MNVHTALYVVHACVCKSSHFLLGIQIITLEIRPSMKAWGEKAKAGVWPARASLHLGITLRSLNGGIPTLRFSGTSNLTQAFLMDVFLSRTGPRKNASSDAKTKYFHRACRTGPTKSKSFDAKTRCVILALASCFPYGFRHSDCSLLVLSCFIKSIARFQCYDFHCCISYHRG